MKQIVLWFTPNSTPTGAGVNTPGSGNYQPLFWTQLADVQLTYNGEVFNRFDSGSAQMWNLVEDQKSSVVNNLTSPNSGAVATTPTTAFYVKCDFAQVYSPMGRESTLVGGKPVLNSVVSLSFTAPAAGILHAMYLNTAAAAA